MVGTRSTARMEQQTDSVSENPSKFAKSEASNEQVKMETNQHENQAEKGMNPLRMEYVVSHLVKFLDLESSKNSRLVCKMWNEESKKNFFQNRVIQVSENFHGQFGSNQKGKNAELDELKEFFSSVGKIQAVKLTDHRDTQSFIRLGLPWEEIEVVVSTISQPEMEQQINAKAFEKLLKKALGVKKVDLPLPKLNKGSGMKLLELCLSAAERRKKGGELNHPILLSALHLRIPTREYLNKVSQLSDSSMIQLEQVAFVPAFNIPINPEIQFELTETLEKILERNKNGLVGFHILDYFGNITPEFKIPVLPQLKNFVLSYRPETAQQQFQFHPDFQFHKNMPNLNMVTLYLGAGRNGQSFWNNVFLNIEPVPTVKILQVHSSLDLVPNKIFETFYSITWLKMNETGLLDLARVGQCCSGLRVLAQSIPEDEQGSKLLVSRITGFSLDIIEMCLNSSVMPNIENFRTNSSLLKLPGVRGLLFLGSNAHFSAFQKYLRLAEKLVLCKIPNFKVEHFENRGTTNKYRNSS